MIRAKLEDGSVVELAQDCECVTHKGPHWLHMNRIEEEQNLREAGPDAIALAGALAPALARHFAQAEVRRLNSLIAAMVERGIVRVLGEEEENAASK